MSTLSVTLIVKNEEDHLARLLPMLGFADEVIVVDTGSDDGTTSVAKKHNAKVFNFPWCDDFSKARNYAISKARGDYVMWLDADDTLPQKTQNALMGWKNSAPKADMYWLRYQMQGQFSFWFWRERIVRRCAQCKFKGFLHEVILPFGQSLYLDLDIVHSPSASHGERNLGIYRNALAKGKRFSLRDRYYFARTLVENDLYDEAEPILRKFAQNKGAFVADRAEAYKLLARCALKNSCPERALRYLSQSTSILSPDAETCCLFGQCFFDTKRYAQSASWYTFALNATSEGCFVNGYYKEFLPCLQLSVCLWISGRREEAKKYHLKAQKISPSHPTVAYNDRFFRDE